MLIGLQVFFIATTLFVSSVLMIKKTRCLVSLGLVFNAYAGLYFVVGLSYYSLYLMPRFAESHMITIANLSLVGILAFNFVYLLAGKSRFDEVRGGVPSRNFFLFVFAIAVFAKLFVIFKVGVVEFFYIDRADRFPILKKYQKILLISHFAKITLVVFFWRYFNFRKRADLKLLVLNFGYLTLMAILFISRAELAFLGICSFYFLDRYNVVKKSKIISIALILVVVMFFYKGVLSGLLLPEQTGKTFNPSEFINWIRNSMILLENRVDMHMLPENSYLLAFKGLVVPKIEALAPSEWFIREFYPLKVKEGLTYGFSGVLEGYLFLGYFGTAIHFSVIALLFSCIERTRGVIHVMLTVCALFIMFRLFRSELYNFFRTYTWYFVYPSLLMVFANWFLVRVSSTNGTFSKV